MCFKVCFIWADKTHLHMPFFIGGEMTAYQALKTVQKNEKEIQAFREQAEKTAEENLLKLQKELDEALAERKRSLSLKQTELEKELAQKSERMKAQLLASKTEALAKLSRQVRENQDKSVNYLMKKAREMYD
jgi:hypothetical protein